MKRALEKVDNWNGKTDSEAFINEIVAKHFEDQNLLQVIHLEDILCNYNLIFISFDVFVGSME